jgi:hypothetical protein
LQEAEPPLLHSQPEAGNESNLKVELLRVKVELLRVKVELLNLNFEPKRLKSLLCI